MPDILVDIPSHARAYVERYRDGHRADEYAAWFAQVWLSTPELARDDLWHGRLYARFVSL